MSVSALGLILLALLSLTQGQTCTTPTCLGVGQKCAGVFNSTQCSSSNTSTTCCNPSLFCLNGTCKVDSNNAACQSTSDCFYPKSGTMNFACVKNGSSSVGVCKQFYGAGDSCSSSADCAANLNCTSGKCQGLALNQNCSAQVGLIELVVCASGLYCSAANLTCQSTLSSGSVCTFPSAKSGQNYRNVYTSAPCAPGYMCNSMKPNGTCVALGSVANGKNCTTPGYPFIPGEVPGLYLCKSGACSPTTGLCTAPNTTVNYHNCTVDSECNSVWSGSTCNTQQCLNGTYYCSIPKELKSWTDLSNTLSLAQCLVSKKCAYSYGSLPVILANSAPNSCAVQQCNSSFAKWKSSGVGGCDYSNLAGTCHPNPYCGSSSSSKFPVWAIVLICIIAAFSLILLLGAVGYIVYKRSKNYTTL